jgi:hypothetical protein
MPQEFVSEEMIAWLLYQAQGGCEYSRCQLEELGVWEPSPALPPERNGKNVIESESESDGSEFGHEVDPWSGQHY